MSDAVDEHLDKASRFHVKENILRVDEKLAAQIADAPAPFWPPCARRAGRAAWVNPRLPSASVPVRRGWVQALR